MNDQNTTNNNNTYPHRAILLPIVGSLAGIGTILLVYIVTWYNNHLPNDVPTPPISLLGCNSPEHEIYQIGFTITGILLFQSIQEWKLVFYNNTNNNVTATTTTNNNSTTTEEQVQSQSTSPPPPPPSSTSSSSSSSSSQSKLHYRCNIATLIGAYMTVLGVIGQGIFTLEKDFLLNHKQGLDMTWQSILHQWMASIFFVGAAIHCYSSILTSYYYKNGERYTVGSFRIKVICVVLSFLSWPLAESLHPLNVTTKRLSKRKFAVGGLAQYITVGSYILYFGSYAIDFYNLQQQQQQQQEKKKHDNTIQKNNVVKPKSS